MTPDQATPTTPEAERWLHDVETIKVFADTLRLQIIKLLAEPTTVKVVAAALDLPPAIEAVVRKAMAKDVAARYPHAAAMLVDADSAGDLDTAVARCADFAMSVASADALVFGQSTRQGSAEDIAVGLLRRAAINAAAGHPLARERLPLNLLARHAGSEGDAAKEAAFHRDFAAQLQLRQDRKARLPLFRALRRAFDGHRLRLMANGSVEPHREATIPPLRTLWLAWNAARRAKR